MESKLETESLCFYRVHVYLSSEPHLKLQFKVSLAVEQYVTGSLFGHNNVVRVLHNSNFSISI